jgi:hypothetical protein
MFSWATTHSTMHPRSLSTNWDTSEREADTYWPSAYVAKPKRAAPGRRTSIRTEERIGSLMAGARILRIVYVARLDFAEVLPVQIPQLRPLEVCATGIRLAACELAAFYQAR